MCLIRDKHMKDQSEHLNVAMPRGEAARIKMVKALLAPGDAIASIKLTKTFMDGIDTLYSSLARRNGKLEQLIRDQCRFHYHFFGLLGCLEEINCEIEDMHPDELLTPWDAKDEAELNNPPLGYGDI